MPYSSGTFTLVSGNPVTTGTTISSTWANSTLSDIADNGLSLCMLKDGTQTPTAALTMGGFRLTNLGAATAVSDAARVSQVQNSSYTSLTAVSGTNTITGTATPTPSAYVAGQIFTFVPAVTNTGAVTLNVSGLGAGAIRAPIDYSSSATAMFGGELRAGFPVSVFVTTTTPVFELIGFQRRFSMVSFFTGTAVASNQTVAFTNRTVAGGSFAQVEVPLSFKAVADALYCKASTGPVSGTFNYTLLIDGSASPLGASTVGNVTTCNSASVVRATIPLGASVSIALEVTSTATAAFHNVSLRLQPVP